MRLPTFEEINIHDSLDERFAAQMFLGKSIAEAVEMFRAHSMPCAEALADMGPQARVFYLAAYLQYLASEDSRGDTDAAAGLTRVAQEVMGSGMDSGEIQKQLLAALERIHSQFARYAPDRLTQRIYHQVPADVRRTIRMLRLRMDT
ncbi:MULTISPECIES: hypothetical protein [unclassified Comamonas]|uniref:hypothetical protein n=1 Tax=unclassified Comamonas TaxID=2638500 RepID=UPI0030A35352